MAARGATPCTASLPSNYNPLYSPPPEGWAFSSEKARGGCPPTSLIFKSVISKSITFYLSSILPSLRGGANRRSNPLNSSAPFKLQSPPFPSSGGVGLFVSKGSGWLPSIAASFTFPASSPHCEEAQPTKQPPEQQRSLQITIPSIPLPRRAAPFRQKKPGGGLPHCSALHLSTAHSSLRENASRRSNPLNSSVPFKLQYPLFPSSGGVGLFVRKGSGWLPSNLCFLKSMISKSMICCLLSFVFPTSSRLVSTLTTHP